MYIEKLNLMNYRNYSQLNLSLHPKMNIIVGSNAQGKTNIIESIYYFSIGKSHRTNKDYEIINWNKENAYMKGNFIKNNQDQIIEIGISNNQNKKVKSNGLLLEKVGDLLGKVHIVLFSPEDLKLIKEGPIERRNFLDREISNIKPQYYYATLEYNKILQQRNHLLKKIMSNQSLRETISVWNEQLIDVGMKIIQTRIYFLKKINSMAKKIHSEITDNKENLELYYQSTILSSQEDIKNIQHLFRKKLEKNINLDIKRGSTSIGPHRDDIKITINKTDIRPYGSQGQQRTAALSLKLAIFKLIHSEVGEFPILLLDDVMSELDQNRQRKLIEYIKDVQSFITCTDLNFLKYMEYQDKKIFKVKNGQIISHLV